MNNLSESLLRLVGWAAATHTEALATRPDVASLPDRQAGLAAMPAAAPARPHARAISVRPFDHVRRSRAKVAFTARRLDLAAAETIVSGKLRPRSGDLVLARVDQLGQHSRIELGNGRKARLHPGDEIIVAYSDRYASDFYEAHVPPDLRPTQLVAAGGVAAQMISRRDGVRRPTDISPIGLIGNSRGEPLNVADFRLERPPRATTRPPVVVVVGTSMNSGKTTTIRYLVHALSKGGYAPGVAKVTGTGAGNDYWMMIDAGAHRMLDFTDVGFASTFRISLPRIELALLELVDHLVAADCGAILLEIADGLYQDETAALIESDVFREVADVVVFAAGEAMGAAHGVARLRDLDLPVAAVSGLLTASPLAAREAAAACRLPVLGIEQLRDPEIAACLLALPAPTLAASSDTSWAVLPELPETGSDEAVFELADPSLLNPLQLHPDD